MGLKSLEKGVNITSGKADFVRRICKDVREKYGIDSVKYIEHEILKRASKLKTSNRIIFNEMYNKCLEEFSEAKCLCDFNKDGSNGCASNIVPENFVFDEWKAEHIDSCGDPRLVNIIEKLNPYSLEMAPAKYRCVYCYAKNKNNTTPVPTALNANNFEKYVQKYKIKIMRLGKSSDFGHKMFRENLIKILEIGARNDVRFILTTKFLEYDKEISEFLKKDNSAVHLSIGGDVFEPGPCLHGRNNAKRIETANEYLQDGVNACLKLLTDFTISPEEAYELGWQTQYALSNFPKERIEMIPLRLESRAKALLLTGETWEELQSPYKGNNLFGENTEKEARYVKEFSGRMIPRKIHDAYSYFVEKKQICGHFGTRKDGFVYCDNCHLNDERIKFPIHELPPPPKTTMARKPQDYEKEKMEREFRKKQMKLNL